MTLDQLAQLVATWAHEFTPEHTQFVPCGFDEEYGVQYKYVVVKPKAHKPDCKRCAVEAYIASQDLRDPERDGAIAAALEQAASLCDAANVKNGECVGHSIMNCHRSDSYWIRDLITPARQSALETLLSQERDKATVEATAHFPRIEMTPERKLMIIGECMCGQFSWDVGYGILPWQQHAAKQRQERTR